MKASDLLVKALENEGVEYIFGIPGEENLDFLDSLKNSKIKFILTRHEQAAGFMAATWGRLTGRTGVCLATLGPGATNFVTSSSYALLGGMPVLFITGQKPIKASKQGRFQIIDIVRTMEPITKFTKQIVNANNIPSLVRHCFRVAEAEKPGPTHLELPEDIAADQVSRSPFTLTKVSSPRASPDDIQRAVDLLNQAKYPLLLVASGLNRQQAFNELQDFIEKTGIYFFSTQMGKGAIDERHPQCLGTAALSEGDYIHCAIDRADLILNLGHDVSEKPPFLMDKHKKVIHFSHYQAQIDDIYFPQLEILGCLKSNIQALTKLTKKSTNWDFDYYLRVKKEVDLQLYKQVTAKSFPNVPQRIVADIRNTVPSETILSLDNGMYKIWFARNYPAHQPNTVLLDNALATMGAGLPAAIACKIIYPKRPVIAICGDGGFMMNSQELETAIRLKIYVTVVIFRDNAYGMIKWKQLGMSLDEFGLDFTNPDFVAYAEAYGAKGYRVQKNGDLEQILKKCLSTNAVNLIEVPVDYSENEKVFLQELKEKTCII